MKRGRRHASARQPNRPIPPARDLSEVTGRVQFRAGGSAFVVAERPGGAVNRRTGEEPAVQIAADWYDSKGVDLLTERNILVAERQRLRVRDRMLQSAKPRSCLHVARVHAPRTADKFARGAAFASSSVCCRTAALDRTRRGVLLKSNLWGQCRSAS